MKNTSKKAIAIVLSLCLLCGCAAGSTSKGTSASTGASGTGTQPPQEAVTLRLCWWGNQTRNDVTQKAIDLYMEQNPGVTIEAEFSDWSGYWDKLATQAAGGGLPDIIQMDYSYLNQYVGSNQLADLNAYINDKTIDTTHISDSIMQSGTMDEKCYAVSLGSTAPMLIYDKATVAAAGVTIPLQPTLEEYYDICQTIYEKTKVPAYFEGGINMMQYIGRARGSEIFGELKEGKADSALEHFQYSEKLAHADFAIAPELLSEKNPLVVESMPIVDLTTWNAFVFSNGYVAIQDACGTDRELGVCMYPTLEDAKKEAEYLKTTMFFSVAETSAHKAQAAKFIDWFVNDEACNKILGGERGVPANALVAEVVKAQMSEVGAVPYDFVAEVNKVASPVDPPNPTGYGEVEAVLVDMIENIRYGKVTAQEAAQRFVPQAQTILQEAAK